LIELAVTEKQRKKGRKKEGRNFSFFGRFWSDKLACIDFVES